MFPKPSSNEKPSVQKENEAMRDEHPTFFGLPARLFLPPQYPAATPLLSLTHSIYLYFYFFDIYFLFILNDGAKHRFF